MPKALVPMVGLGMRAEAAAMRRGTSTLALESATATTCLLSVQSSSVASARSCVNRATARSRLTTPEAHSEWPTVLLVAKSCSGCPAAGAAPCREWSAPTSMGSPRGVPVPCSWAPCTSVGCSGPWRRALSITSLWEGPLGAVSALDRPSWLSALPTYPRQAATGWGSRPRPVPMLMLTHASPRPYPSALASSVLHRPAWPSIPLRNIALIILLSRCSCTEATRHSLLSCSRSELQATCMEAREEEHAVSTVTHGPCRS
eukprot:scaffold3342_cov324-Prasinococcus_capsulatus_cf.AAC.1